MGKPNIKAVILDWSGVVSDDWQATFDTTNEILEGLGHRRLSMDEFKERYELPWMNFYKNLDMEVDFESELKRWMEIFPKHYGSVKPYPYAKQVIEKLKEKGMKIVVLSAHHHLLVQREIKDYGMQGLIDAFDGSNEDKREKINSLIQKHVIERQGCIFVGDMCHDIETAKHAGIKSVAVLGGYDKKEKLLGAKPDYLIEGIAELPGLVEKLNGGSSG